MAHIKDLFGNKSVPNPPPGRRQFSPYSAGKKSYGGGRSFPNMGPVSGEGKAGYSERDNKTRARRSAIMRRMRAQNTGNPKNKDVGGAF